MNFLRNLFGKNEEKIIKPSNDEPVNDIHARSTLEIQAQKEKPVAPVNERQETCLALYLFDSNRISEEVSDSYGKYAEGELLKALSWALKPDGGWAALCSPVQACRGDIFENSVRGEPPTVKVFTSWLKGGTYGSDATNLDSIVATEFRSEKKLGYVPYITGLAPLQKFYAVRAHEQLKASSVVGYIGLVTLDNAPFLAKVAKELGLPLRFEIKDSEYSGKLLATRETAREAGLQQAIQPLIDALKNADRNVREEAADTLGNVRDPRAVEPLIEALSDTNASVRGSVAWALGYIGDMRAVQPLTGALKDESEYVRERVAEALKELGHSA